MSSHTREIRGLMGAINRVVAEMEREEKGKHSELACLVVGLPLVAVLYAVFVGF